MRNTLAVLIVSFVLVLLTGVVSPLAYAVESSSTAAPKPSPQVIKEAQNKIEQKLDQRLEKVASNAAALGKKDFVSSRSAALRTKLAAFKDKQKATLVQKVSDTLNQINSMRTDMMLKHVGVLTDIYTKLLNKEKTANLSGPNAAAVQAALNNAQSSIAIAKSTVEAQKAKDYTIVVSSESGVRADAKKSRDQLQTDLKATHQTIVDARKALADAIASALKGGTK
jgi:hypothetical protein